MQNHKRKLCFTQQNLRNQHRLPICPCVCLVSLTTTFDGEGKKIRINIPVQLLPNYPYNAIKRPTGSPVHTMYLLYVNCCGRVENKYHGFLYLSVSSIVLHSVQ